MLTKKEKAQLYRAANRIWYGYRTYSCPAIATIHDSEFLLLREKYAEFYEFSLAHPADFVGSKDRILALLLFAEVQEL